MDCARVSVWISLMVRFAHERAITRKGPRRHRSLFSGGSRITLHDRADASLRIEEGFLGAVKVGRVTTTGHDVELFEPGGVTLLMPLRGRAQVDTGERRLEAGPGGALLLPAGRRMTRVEPDLSGIYLGSPVILPICADRGLPPTFRPRGATPTGSTLEQHTISLYRWLFDEVEAESPLLDREKSRDAWIESLYDSFAALLAEDERPRREEASRAEMRVRQAEEYMRAHLDEATVADVARACGVTVRTLDMAFRQVRDATPKSILTALRLQEARRLLLAPEGPATVTEACFRAGLGHPSRFAQAYRASFGENPSRTLAARRG